VLELVARDLGVLGRQVVLVGHEGWVRSIIVSILSMLHVVVAKWRQSRGKQPFGV
jgi:hypothetical protein